MLPPKYRCFPISFFERNQFVSNPPTHLKNSISSRLILNSIKLSRHRKIALGRVFTEFKAELLNE